MKHLNQYINIKKTKSLIHVNDSNLVRVLKEELDRLGHDADLNHIDTSEVTDMYCLFTDLGDIGKKNDYYKDVNPDISKWNVSNVKDMRYMFYKCYNFNCDISEWDVSNVKMSQFMFKGCESFNQDLSQWDVSKVEDMYEMFYGCKNFNQDISQWNVSHIKNALNVFTNCPIKEEFKPKFAK